MALPSLAETMLTKNAELHNICFQYYTPAVVVLFFAAVEAWRGMIRRKDRNDPRPRPLRLSRPTGSHRLRPAWCLLVAAVVGCWLVLAPGLARAATPIYVDAVNGNNDWDGESPVWDGVHGPIQTIEAGISAVDVGSTNEKSPSVHAQPRRFVL